MNRFRSVSWPAFVLLLALPAAAVAGDKGQPAINVKVVDEGPCSAVVGDAVYFPFTQPGLVNPDKNKEIHIERFEVVVDGKVIDKPEVHSTNLKEPLPGGPSEISVFLRPAKAGTFKVAITPVYGNGKSGPTRTYLLTVSAGPRSKTVDGLAAWAEVRSQGGTPVILLCLQNLSDQPIRVFDWVGDYPLKVVWKGPDGKVRDSNPYAWLANVKLAPPSKENIGMYSAFLAPHQVIHLGPHGRLVAKEGEGIRLAGAEPGEHRVSVSYANTEKGKQFDAKAAPFWTGTVTAPEMAILVK
jgi:hypothetical protein